MESRKQAVSIRMSASDVRKIKRLAERLGVRDSDVIRFAVKSMLGKLGALHDPVVRGRSLVPVFLDHGYELCHHFELDATRLEGIINKDADVASAVDRDDIQLIAMSSTRQPYVRWSVERRPAAVDAAPGLNGSSGRPENGSSPEPAAHEIARQDEGDRSATYLRAYLFEKYLYRDGGAV
jgi:hypothetical protein